MQASGYIPNRLVSQSLKSTAHIDVVAVLTAQVFSVPEQSADPRSNRVYAASSLLIPRASNPLLNWNYAVGVGVLDNLLVLALFAHDYSAACTTTDVALHDWKVRKFHNAPIKNRQQWVKHTASGSYGLPR